jgi:hypothetical protein
MAKTGNVEWRGLLEEMARVGRAVHRLGLRGSLRFAAARLGRLAYLREAHVWYLLDIESDLERTPLPPGVEIVSAGEADLEMLQDLPTISRRLARRRLREGAELWLAREHHRAVFGCWIFHGRTPALGAPGGWLGLPADTVGLEDVITSPGAHAWAIAPAIWSAVADRLAARSIGNVVTKIEETNLSCRRAIERVGFRAIASMQLSRIGGHARVALHLHAQSGNGFLAGQLAR